MVGRNDQHEPVAITVERLQRRYRDRGGRVAADRLEDRAAAGEIDHGEVGARRGRHAFRRQSG